MVIWNPQALYFEVLIVFCFGNDFVFKSILAPCEGPFIQKLVHQFIQTLIRELIQKWTQEMIQKLIQFTQIYSKK